MQLRQEGGNSSVFTLWSKTNDTGELVLANSRSSISQNDFNLRNAPGITLSKAHLLRAQESVDVSFPIALLNSCRALVDFLDNIEETFGRFDSLFSLSVQAHFELWHLVTVLALVRQSIHCCGPSVEKHINMLLWLTDANLTCILKTTVVLEWDLDVRFWFSHDYWCLRLHH